MYIYPNIEQIYTQTYQRDPIADNKDEDEDEELQQPIVEFSATSYAVLESEQRLDIKIQRRGPANVEVRFRCSDSFARLLLHAYAILRRE